MVKVKVKKFPCSMYQSMYQRHKYNNMPHLIIMFFLFGVAGATPDIGDRCAVGHCENPNDCPRCRAGLRCETAADQMCAGTCYGVCASSTTPSSGGSNNNYHNNYGPSPAPAPASCTDLKYGVAAGTAWNERNSASNTCPVMVQHGYCTDDYFNTYDGVKVTSSMACCGCGGGSRPRNNTNSNSRPDIGDRCAVDHFENPNVRPRCRAGLMCDTAADQMCVHTCYGVCASTTPSPDSHRSGNRSVTGCARAGDTCMDITGPGTCTLDGATSTSLSCIVQVVYDSFFSTNQTNGHSSSSPSTNIIMPYVIDTYNCFCNVSQGEEWDGNKAIPNWGTRFADGKYDGTTCKHGADDQLKTEWDKLTPTLQAIILNQGTVAEACEYAKLAVAQKIFGSFSDAEASLALGWCCNKPTIMTTTNRPFVVQVVPTGGTGGTNITDEDDEDADFLSLSAAGARHSFGRIFVLCFISSIGSVVWFV